MIVLIGEYMIDHAQSLKQFIYKIIFVLISLVVQQL